MKTFPDFKQNSYVKVKDQFQKQAGHSSDVTLKFLRYTTKSKSYATVQNDKGTFQIETAFLEPAQSQEIISR